MVKDELLFLTHSRLERPLKLGIAFSVLKAHRPVTPERNSRLSVKVSPSSEMSLLSVFIVLVFGRTEKHMPGETSLDSTRCHSVFIFGIQMPIIRDWLNKS